jgi:hypothetical protein
MDKKQELINKGVEFKAISSTMIKAKLPTINYEVIKEDRTITSIIYEEQSISIGDSYCCNVTDKINSPEVDYRINTITINEEDQRIIHLFESIYNNTTILAFPLVFPDKDESGYISNNAGYLMNAYVSCGFEEGKDKYSIFVLLRHMTSRRFKNQEKIYTENKNFIRAIDINVKHVLYEFTIPEELHNDYDVLLSGKYSKLSKKAANQILSFHGKDLMGGVIYRAITKDPKFRQEIAKDYNVDIEDIEELYPAFSEKDVLTKNML